MQTTENAPSVDGKDYWPPGYSRMVNRLIRRIGGHGEAPMCWNDREVAIESLALLDREAADMRKEAMHLDGVPNVYGIESTGDGTTPTKLEQPEG